MTAAAPALPPLPLGEGGGEGGMHATLPATVPTVWLQCIDCHQHLPATREFFRPRAIAAQRASRCLQCEQVRKNANVTPRQRERHRLSNAAVREVPVQRVSTHLQPLLCGQGFCTVAQ